MPARPNVPNVVKVEFVGTNGSYNWANVLHASWSGASPSVAALTSFATALGALWGTDMKSLYNPAVELESVIITDLTSDTGNQGTANPNIVGTSAGGPTPANAAILVNYPSSIRYRGGHPRTYWPGPSVSELNNEISWTAGLVTAVGTFMTALQNDLSTLTSGGTNLAGQCAVSYVTDKAPRVTPLVMAISNGAFTVEARCASQRRRIGRR